MDWIYTSPDDDAGSGSSGIDRASTPSTKAKKILQYEGAGRASRHAARIAAARGTRGGGGGSFFAGGLEPAAHTCQG